MGKIKSFLFNRLDERSTWRAIIALITLAGLKLEPGQAEAIITAGVAIGAVFEMFLPDPAGNMRKPPIDRLPDDPVSPEREAVAKPKHPGKQSGADRSRQDWLGD